MGPLNKKLTAALNTTTPEKQRDLGDLCKKSAEAMRDTAALLDQAGEAFKHDNFSDGCSFLGQAEDSIAKA